MLKFQLGAALLLLHSIAHAVVIEDQSHMTVNMVDQGQIAVGKTVPTTSSGQPPPVNNEATVLDETALNVTLQYATVFNQVVEKDYFYFFIELTMDKPADYSKFTVMLYAQIITSDDDPIKHQTTEPTIETCSMTTPFYGEEELMGDQLWMLNQYSYTEEEGVEKGLFYATGPWNDQLDDDKIDLGGGMLWGWDATASNQSETEDAT